MRAIEKTLNIKTNILKSTQKYVRFQSENENSSMIFNLKHSYHSIKRSCQRGISSEQIAITAEFGICYFGQGLNYYVLGKKDVPFQLRKKSSNKGLVQKSLQQIKSPSDDLEKKQYIAFC